MTKVNKILRTPRAELEAAIARGRSLRRVDLSDYCALVGIHNTTLHRRRKDPATLTIREARRIAKVAEIDFGEFASNLSG